MDPSLRLKREMDKSDIEYTITTHGSLSCYTFEIWKWKFQMTPSDMYPTRPQIIKYMRPDESIWQDYQVPDNQATYMLTLETLAMSVIGELTDNDQAKD